jgi:3-dehydroquinate synthetase
VPVALSDGRAYEVAIGPGAIPSVLSTLPALLGRAPARAFLIVDSGVPAALHARVTAALESLGTRVTFETLAPTEPAKSLDTHARLLGALAATGAGRDEPVIALGGGIVGDLAGFVAASYRRGVPVVQCPTTLLSMVDASVGGKTGVNLSVQTDSGARLLKNMAGAFHQPIAVAADTTALASLPPRVFAAGLAECVKHALLSAGLGTDPGLLSWTETRADLLDTRDDAALAELIARNVAVKAAVVAGDERELAPSAEGGRALLNLGHTFAHAIETLPGLSPVAADPSLAPLQHGEAVAIGLVAACATAAEMGLASADLESRVATLLARLGLPVRVAGLPGDDALLDAMRHDKKVLSGTLRLVLPVGPGACRVVEDPPLSAVRAGWDAVRQR